MPDYAPNLRSDKLLATAILLTLCLIPALGSLALLPMIFAFLFGLPAIFTRRSWCEGGAKRWVWVILLTYIFYFTIGDVLLQGDLAASLRAMAPNSPLLAAAVVAMAVDPARSGTTAVQIGHWTTVSVYSIFAFATLIWLTQPSLQILGTSLTNATLVNDRLSLLVGNPLPFAASYMTLGFVALLGWHRRAWLARGLALGAVSLAMATVAFWSQSRGATLAAVPLLALAIWYIRPRPIHAIAAVICVFAVGAIVIGLGGHGDRVEIALSRLVRGLMTFMTGDMAVDTSTAQRVMMYRAGLLAWQQSPIWGHGITQQFAAAIPYFPQDQIFRYTHLHNTVLTHAVSGGVLGVGVLLAVICSPFAVNRAISSTRSGLDDVDKRDRRYFAALIFLVLFGVGMTSLILRHDVSANFLGALLLTHLVMQCPASAVGVTKGSSEEGFMP